MACHDIRFLSVKERKTLLDSSASLPVEAIGCC
jgi:hypothetical protein